MRRVGEIDWSKVCVKIMQKLHNFHGGSELYESLPGFSADIVTLVFYYACPISLDSTPGLPNRLRQEFLTETQFLRRTLSDPAAALLTVQKLRHYSIYYDGRWGCYSVIRAHIGVPFNIRLTWFRGTANYVWAKRYRISKQQVAKGKYKCPIVLWARVLQEHDPNIHTKFTLAV